MVTIYKHCRRWRPYYNSPDIHGQWWKFQAIWFWLNLKSNFLTIRETPQWNGLLFKLVKPLLL